MNELNNLLSNYKNHPARIEIRKAIQERVSTWLENMSNIHYFEMFEGDVHYETALAKVGINGDHLAEGRYKVFDQALSMIHESFLEQVPIKCTMYRRPKVFISYDEADDILYIEARGAFDHIAKK